MTDRPLVQLVSPSASKAVEVLAIYNDLFQKKPAEAFPVLDGSLVPKKHFFIADAKTDLRP